MCSSVITAKAQFGDEQRFRPAAALLICAVGICASYLLYGMLQESLFANSNGVGASFILLSQGVTNTLVAVVWQHIDSLLGDKTKQVQTKQRRLHHALLVLTAFCYFVAMAASNESLRYVSYPTAVLAKSSKLIPTMVLGALIERRVYHSKEWLAAACITSGVVLFNLSKIHESGSTIENSLYGLTLLCLSLFFDGLLGACQGLLKQEDNATYQPPTATETMLYINLYAAVFLFPLSIYLGEWQHGTEVFIRDQQLQRDLIWLNAAAACGQIFIFLTITWYSSLACTTITTTRKFFTILLSVVHFGHHFTWQQWASVALVFCGLYMGIITKTRIEPAPTKKTE